MKVERCTNCGSAKLPVVDYPLKAKLGGVAFEASVRAQQCQNCGEAFLSGQVLKSFEISAALELARAGVTVPEGLQFMRKVVGLRAIELAELLELTPEHVSRMENGRASADRRTVALLAAMVEDKAAGATRTVDQLRALARPRRVTRRVQIPAAGAAKTSRRR